MSGWKARRTPCASLLFSAAAAFIFLLPPLAAPLQYDRAAIAGGEVWRLFSGHWVHSSFDHLFWDVLAFGFLGIACEAKSRSRFLVCVTMSAFAISLVVWLCRPDLMAYRGLSGVDSALFGLLFVELGSEGIRSRRPFEVVVAAVCFLCFLLKISFELITGRNLFVESVGSGWMAVPLAHIAGAAVGLLVGLGGVKDVTFSRDFVISQ